MISPENIPYIIDADTYFGSVLVISQKSSKFS